MLRKAEKEDMRRVSVILDTPMSDQNKIKAMNTFAIPVLTYFMPVIYFCQDDLQKVNLKIRRLLTDRGARHPQYLNTLLYPPRAVGGRGLKEVATTYKETRIKAALRITASKDPKLRAMTTFQQAKESKGRRSNLKDTKKYVTELKLILELDGDPEI